MGTKMVENRRNEEKIAKGNNSLNPNLFASCSFEDLGLHPTLCDQLRERMKFKVPTAIQAQAIPTVISGHHALVNAATGTGKTIVYLAPIIHHLQMHTPRIKRADGTFALVLVPTRELCLQVYEILQNLLHRFHWIVPGYVMGGENRSKEKARLRKGISILIATPGRLLDHLKHTSSFVHNKMRWVIFDEADRILELGFGKDIEEILDVLGTREPELDTMDTKAPEVPAVRFPRQNLLLSATLNEKVNHLAKISLDNPSMIGLEGPANHRLKFSYEDSDSLNSNAPATHSSTLQSCSIVDYKLPAQLVQKYVKVTCGSRLVALLSSLKFLYGKEASQKVVVFFSTCDGVDFHFSLFSKFQSPSEQNVEQKQAFLPCKVLRLHGSMEQEDRRTSFQSFNSERSAILLCTDVAARGLDFPKVRYIIQYDSPGDAIEYVHRVGRTARLGEKGVALVFLLATELDYLRELKKHGVTLDEFPIQKVLGSFPIPGGRKHKKSISIDSHPWVMHLQKSVESFILAETELKSLAKEAFCSWVRAYTAHRGELKQVFMVKKLHLGHVARSFGLREQPSLVGRSFQLQMKKRKKEQKKGGMSKKRRVVRKPETAGRG